MRWWENDFAFVRRNKLYLAGRKAEDLAGRFGTPVYVYGRKAISSRFAFLAEEFTRRTSREAWICYALKANPHPGIASFLQEKGARIDAVFPNEVAEAPAVGYTPERILFTGTSVSVDDLMSRGGQVRREDAADESRSPRDQDPAFIHPLFFQEGDDLAEVRDLGDIVDLDESHEPLPVDDDVGPLGEAVVLAEDPQSVSHRAVRPEIAEKACLLDLQLPGPGVLRGKRIDADADGHCVELPERLRGRLEGLHLVGTDPCPSQRMKRQKNLFPYER